MEIQILKEIFDDPEYCSVGGTLRTESDYCHYGCFSLCRVFVDKYYSPISRKYDDKKRSYIKCPECKEAWKKAKNDTKT